jgi:hypothetical protein
MCLVLQDLGDILSERENIAQEMQELLHEATEPWGVTVQVWNSLSSSYRTHLYLAVMIPANPEQHLSREQRHHHLPRAY